MVTSAEDLSWNELPDMMCVDECRRFLRIGDRQCRRWAKAHGIYLMIGGSARISKQGLARALSDEGVEVNFNDGLEQAEFSETK